MRPISSPWGCMPCNTADKRPAASSPMTRNRVSNSAHRCGYVRDNFTKQSLMERCPARWPSAICAIRPPAPRRRPRSATQPFFGEFAMGACAIAHNGNITNAMALRRELIERGSIFKSSSDSRCIIHLMARSIQRNIPERMKGRAAPGRGAFSVIADPHQADRRARSLGVRPLVAWQDRR